MLVAQPADPIALSVRVPPKSHSLMIPKEYTSAERVSMPCISNSGAAFVGVP